MNAWICAPRSTDRDPTLDRLQFLCGLIVLELIKIRNIRNLIRIYCFGINLIFVTVFTLAEMVMVDDDGMGILDMLLGRWSAQYASKQSVCIFPTGQEQWVSQ